MKDNLEHICPAYRTVTRAIPDGAPIYLNEVMWLSAIAKAMVGTGGWAKRMSSARSAFAPSAGWS